MPAKLTEEEIARRLKVKQEAKVQKEIQKAEKAQKALELADLKKKDKELRKEERDLENEKYRSCAFTLHWYSDEDIERLKQLPCRYIVFGKEHTKQQVPHLQGYIEFGGAQFTLKQLKKMIGKSAHIKRRHEFSTPRHAAGYCKKGTEETETGAADKFFDAPSSTWDGFEWGFISKQGERHDIEAKAVEVYKQEVSCDELSHLNPRLFNQYGRTFQRIEDVANRNKFRTWMTTATWYYGGTDVGKSHIAHNCPVPYHPSTHYIWKKEKDWQCGS